MAIDNWGKKARAGEVVLLSQDEARFPMVPTLVRTLGLKGQRPIVGTTDNKDVVYAFASLNVTDERLITRLLSRTQRQRRLEGSHKTRRLQAMFARHLGDVGGAYPAAQVTACVGAHALSPSLLRRGSGTHGLP